MNMGRILDNESEKLSHGELEKYEVLLVVVMN